ncbi:MAG: LysE family translocator [Herbaspirillum sp.]|nr:LysE family translocator [Herbaspirillum sp.]
MPSLHLFLLFLTASLALNLTPGPDMALTLTRGMTQGFRVAWLSVLGTFAAGAVQIPLVVFGLAGVFRESPMLFETVKIAGALYLVYLGVRALRRSLQGKQSIATVAARGEQGVFWQGLFTNLLNPKVFLFLVAFLPQFADPAVGPVWQQMLVLAISSKVLGLLNGTCFAYGASRIRHWLGRNPWFLRLQDSILGVAMLGIAGYIFFNRTPGHRGG